jgi:hypothetical protein
VRVGETPDQEAIFLQSGRWRTQDKARTSGEIDGIESKKLGPGITDRFPHCKVGIVCVECRIIGVQGSRSGISVRCVSDTKNSRSKNRIGDLCSGLAQGLKGRLGIDTEVGFYLCGGKNQGKLQK